MNAVRNMDGLDRRPAAPGRDGHDRCRTTRSWARRCTLIQYDPAKKYFNYIGEPLDFEGKTAELTPENLITG